jgi:hypothetical protein
MFRVMLHSQWKWSRLVVIAGTFAAFAIPVLSLQSAGGRTPAGAREILGTMERWSVPYRLLAAAFGLLIAITAWSADHRGRHVYAMALPLPRWRYVLYRFGAGLVLLSPGVLAVTIGGVLATMMATLPSGLHGYPFALALRFALALVLAYAMFFAISSGTTRTAAAVLIVFGAIGCAQVFGVIMDWDFLSMHWLMDAVLAWRGPFALFAGRWMLVDV